MSADDVYALTAYIPALNGMVPPGFVAAAEKRQAADAAQPDRVIMQPK
jgi:hypothetical protein